MPRMIEQIRSIPSKFEKRVPTKPVLGRGGRGGGAWAVLHHYITAHEQTRLSVCYFRLFDVFLASRESSFRTNLITFITKLHKWAYYKEV